MKLQFGLALITSLFLLPFGAQAGDPPAQWPPLPPGTRTLLLVTGSDEGFYLPKGCNGDWGGTVYRLNFNRYLAQTAPDILKIWLSTGDLGKTDEESKTIPYAEMLDFLGRVGYQTAGLGTFDLQQLDLLGLSRRTDLPVPIRSLNIVVHETGKSIFPPARVFETPSGRLLVVAVSAHLPEQVWGDPAIGTVITVPPSAPLARFIKEQKKPGDRLVLLSSLHYQELKELLEEVDGVDLALASAGTYETATPLPFGKTPVLWLGAEGRLLGRVTLDDTGKILEAMTVQVRGQFPIDPATGMPIPPSQP